MVYLTLQSPKDMLQWQPYLTCHLDCVWWFSFWVCFFSQPQPHSGVSPAPQNFHYIMPSACPQWAPDTLHSTALQLRKAGPPLCFLSPLPAHWNHPSSPWIHRVGKKNKGCGVKQVWRELHLPHPFSRIWGAGYLGKWEMLAVFPTFSFATRIWRTYLTPLILRSLTYKTRRTFNLRKLSEVHAT